MCSCNTYLLRNDNKIPHRTKDFVTYMYIIKLLLYFLMFSEKFQWMVPVSVSSQNKALVKTLLDKPSVEVTVQNVQPDHWVKVCCRSRQSVVKTKPKSKQL